MTKVEQYYRDIARREHLEYLAVSANNIDTALLESEQRHQYIKLQAIPIRANNGVLIIATANPTEKNVKAIEKHFHQDNTSLELYVTSMQEITDVLTVTFQKEYAHEIVYKHHDIDVVHSALYTFSTGEKVSVLCFFAILTLAFYVAPLLSLNIICSILTFGTTWVILYKSYLSCVALILRLPKRPKTPFPYPDDADLPIYSVLIPLFKEKEITIRFLMKQIHRLDYPKEKLDIKLLLEPDDDETINIIKKMDLPQYYEMLLIPVGVPRSKPRACNFGLEFARGEFLAIYDAEDRPDKNQLRMALHDLSDDPEKHVCTQAALNYYNNKDNILTRIFTMEYSHWFDQLVPALAFLKVPVPLGGTSNHFRTWFLRQVEGWDPSIGTEDADIGIRIYRRGYRTSAVRTTTYEEASSTFKNWHKQRTRWAKGYYQTYLVNMRDPIQFIRQVGLRQFMHFQFFVGGNVFCFLANLPIWLYLIAGLLLPHDIVVKVFPTTIFSIQLFNFFIANMLLVVFQFLSAVTRKEYFLLPYAPLIPLYWLLMSVAGYCAIYDLLVRPGYWYKTEHGTSKTLIKK